MSKGAFFAVLVATAVLGASSAMAEMVGKFMLPPELERGPAAPVRTGNPVVDRSLSSAGQKLGNLRPASTGPTTAKPAAHADSKSRETEPARRRVAGGGEIDWKEF